MKRTVPVLALLLGCGLLAAQETTKTPDNGLPAGWSDAVQWRSIGPANMGGRIVDLAVYEKDPKTFWAATASGGLLKTTNNGTTFEHQFDHEGTVSIGAVAVAQSNPDIVWVGTGENHPRNSVSYGDGVYKSVDGGKTWTHMGLRESFQIGDIVIHPTDPDVVYVGALGRLYGTNEERGLYKTRDGGKTWDKVLHIDDKTGVVDIAMQPEDPDVLLVATYERQRDEFDTNDPAKKIGPGSGLHRSTDGGKTFQRVTEGLPSCKLGRIGLHWYRKNPAVVFAIVESEMIGKAGARVGWSGLETQDAETGAKITGVTDDSPAAAAGLQKDDIVLAVDGSTVLSSRKFEEAIAGFEVDAKVRLEVARKGEVQDFTVTLAKRPERPAGQRGGRGGVDATGDPFDGSLGGQVANVQRLQGKDGHEHGGVYRSDDSGATWRRINSLNPRPMYFSQVRVDPSDDQFLYVLGVQASRSKDGGDTFTSDMGRGVHADQHALWIDPADGRHMILGCDGGVYVTYDRCENWEHLNHAALGQFYHVAVGPRRDYWVYGGLQDNGSWGAPHRNARGSGPVNESWLRIGGGDGFVCAVDSDDPDQIYYESQNGGMGRTNLRTMEGGSIRPAAPPANRGGRGARAQRRAPAAAAASGGEERPARGRRGRRGARGGQAAAGGETAAATQTAETAESEESSEENEPQQPQQGRRAANRYRFNWKTPFMLSNHNSRIFYCAGNHVFRSLDRGNDLKPISPEITLTERGSAAAISESPRDADVLYVGTDDGALWGTRDGGQTWTDLLHAGAEEIDATDASAAGARTGEGEMVRNIVAATEAQPLSALIPGPRHVAALEASRFETGRVYLTLDGHRSDDDDPHVLVSEDYGMTWTSLRSNLPWGSTRALREDRSNADVLYLGTEFGLWLSIDRGAHWMKFNGNLPTVAVHDIAQHATSGEIVVATHGRSLWVLDVTPFRQMSTKTLAEDAHLYQPNAVVRWRTRHRHGDSGGARSFTGDNPDTDAEIYYSLGKNAGAIRMTVRDAKGEVLRTIETKSEAGLHRVVWDLRREPSAADVAERERRMRERFGADWENMMRRFRGRGGRGGGAPAVANGTYEVVLEVDGQTFKQSIEVQPDPNFPDGGPQGRFGEDEDFDFDDR